MKYLLVLIAMLFAGTPGRAEKPMLEFRLGLDYLALEQSDIRGLNGMSVFYTTPQGFYGGTSIYSAAFGAGGGFFVGGWEVGKRTGFSDRFFWDASLFIGGGGGANQVTGGGLMLRPQVHFGYDFGRVRIGAGVSGISVSGSEISTPAFALTLTRPLDLELVSGHPQAGGLTGATRIKALTPIVRNYVPLDSNKRGGAVLNSMQLLGAELTFGNDPNRESFVQASGVVRGDAEGYADWILGQRYMWRITPLTVFADFGAGIGGGGAVDTGGGLVVATNVGAKLNIMERLDLSFTVGAISSVNGDFLALTPSLRASLAFGSGATSPSSVRWQAGTGAMQLLTTPDFRKTGNPSTSSPALIYTDLDVFLTKGIYLTGQAYTAATGDAGGFQIGLVGLGYTKAVSRDLALSAELLLGSAAGAGVNAQGGLVGGYRFELDYKISEALSASIGVGQLQTLQNGGLHPGTVSLGLKFPITTLH